MPTSHDNRASQRRPPRRAVADSPRGQLAWRIVLLLLVIAIGYLATTPKPPPRVDFGWDKLNHVLAFASLAVAGFFAFPPSRRKLPLLLLILLAYGGAIEIAQSFVPGRQAEWADWLADAVGVACGVLLALSLRFAARRL